MKIFVPYTEIQPATRVCLGTYEYTPVRMVGNDDYQLYFKQRWEDGEAFINCEHDTVFFSGAIEDLEQCPEEWCVFGVGSRDAEWNQDSEEPSEEKEWYIKKFSEKAPPSLALAKFSHEFIKKLPDVWTDMDKADSTWMEAWWEKVDTNDLLWKKGWDSLRVPKWLWCDAWLAAYATLKGITCHQHYPIVVNANPRYPTPPQSLTQLVV